MSEKLPVHPAAHLFPMMAEKEFAELVEDIRQHGQEEQIIVWRGQLLDGRNRLKACEQLGIQPNIGELDGDLDPVQYVLSHNLHRRHLTETQRSMVAAKLATLKRGDVGRGGAKKDPSIEGTSVKEASQLLNVGHASVERAKKVIDKAAPALVEAVERGEVAVSLAAKLVDECDDKREQARLAKAGSEAIREFMTPPAELKRKPCVDEKAVAAFRKAENRLNVLRHIVAELDDMERRVLLEWVSESEA